VLVGAGLGVEDVVDAVVVGSTPVRKGQAD
jgi:hypothetical protein